MATLKKINKTYHILVYSNLTTNTVNQSNNCTAFFDFGRLPKSRWRVKYYGAFGAVGFTNNILPQIHVNFGQMKVDYGRNTSNAYPLNSRLTRQCVGNMISYTNYGSGCSFNVPAGDNGYFYLDNTPTDNIINIQVFNLANQTYWVPNMSNAVYGFAFEQLDDPIYRTVKNVYNVVFNSDYGANGTTSNNSLGWKRYFFDWTRLPEGEYEVSTIMHTSTDPSNVANFSGYQISCDFGQGGSTVFMPTSLSNARMPYDDFLCMVFVEQPGSVGPLVAYRDYTPPVFLQSRPYNYDVNIYINNHYISQGYYSRTTGVDMDYTICFTFRWLGNRNDD
jgi:hypothetical protein